MVPISLQSLHEFLSALFWSYIVWKCGVAPPASPFEFGKKGGGKILIKLVLYFLLEGWLTTFPRTALHRI